MNANLLHGYGLREVHFQNTSKLILAYVSFFCSMLRVLHGTGVICWPDLYTPSSEVAG